MNPPDDIAPDYRRGFLRVPLSVWQDLYCRTPLTRRQLQIVSVVLRESWGWQTKGGDVYRWTRPLTSGQMAKATGLSTDHLTRDLRALVAGGVLREQARLYQLVADPRLWITPPLAPQKSRSRAPEAPASTAERALSPPDVKIKHKKQRNVALPVDKSLSPWVSKADREGKAARLEWEVRFLQVVIAFAGELKPEEVDYLRRWLQREGVARVWASLAASFRQGPMALRHVLQVRLGEQAGSAG